MRFAMPTSIILNVVKRPNLLLYSSLAFFTVTLLISSVQSRRRPTIQIGTTSASLASTPATTSTPGQSLPSSSSSIQPIPVNGSASSITSPSLDHPFNQVNPILPIHRTSSTGIQKIVFGAILPTTILKTLARKYNKTLQDAVDALTKGRDQHNFINYFEIANANVVLMPLNPSPTDVLHNLCHHLLPNGVSTIFYMTNSDTYGTNAAATQYLMQLTGYLGIPMIAWNADNMGLAQRISDSRILQLAPSLEHQASAMLSIARRYSWHVFSIITSSIGGHEDFVRAVRDQILSFEDFKFNILDIFTIKKRTPAEIRLELDKLAKSEARVIFLYSTKQEAQKILEAASSLGITGKNYIWIVTRSIVGTASEHYAPNEFPPGMLGIHFNTSHWQLLKEIERAVTIYGYALDLFVEDGSNLNKSLSPNLSCNGSGDSRWENGDLFFKYLRSVKIKSKYGKSNLEFNLDGTLKFVELDVMNLNQGGIWEKIGVWTEQGLEIKDITWPANSPVPPQGVPEKFSLKVTFLEEPPFVIIMPPDEETGACKTNKAVRCRYAPEAQLIGVNKTLAYRNPNYYRCCSGFCIDLLEKFANDLRFSYELSRVEDGAWGVLSQNRTWNGLIAELLDHKADVVATSIKINSDRQAYVDFTVPFLETGITILVAKRTGIISPKAFLEPFDTHSWIMILLISIQIAVFSIFLFEWLSPSGYNMGMKPPKGHKFSLFRTYWLVWAILFGAAVPVNCPKGLTARFMSNVWATFAVVFLAIYTANLAAFMITREDYHDFSGIEDPRLANPTKVKPALKFGTLPSGNTEAVLKRNKPQMHAYMRKYNRSSSELGVKAVRKGDLDAFIYDAVVLDYYTGQDNDCRLLTVGSWYAMTGYGFAFPKKSKYLNKFNEKMIEYRENGDLERLRRFWFQGACKPTRNKGKLSKPLDVNKFMSAFLLLGCGILLTIIILAIEHIYFHYFRKPIINNGTDGCLNLVSMSIAKSLSNDDNSRLSRGNNFWTSMAYNDGLNKNDCRNMVGGLNRYKAEHLLDNIKRSKSFAHLNEDEMMRFQTSNWSSSSSTVPYPRLNQPHYLHKDMTHNHITTNDPFYGRDSTSICTTYSTSTGLRERRIKPGFTSNKQTFPLDKSTAAITEFETVL
uniref:Glutamate receptor ionotropic, NMDA 2B n=1 Tax=Tetranychus urticae TaxID=32264 RepID=T1JWS9_TETUR